MKRLAASLALVLFLVAAKITLGQGASEDRGKDDPFFDRSDRGETIHVLPTHAAAAGHSAHGPYSFAPPSRGTAVYGASYGSGNLIDHGGLELSDAKFVAIYWNSAVANATATSTLQGFHYPTIKDQMHAFVASFSDGSNWDNSATDDFTVVQQYGSRVAISSALPFFHTDIVDTKSTSSSIQDSQIQSYLAGLFGTTNPARHVDADPTVIYGVYFPPGMTVRLGGASCSSFCGYHSHFTYGGVQVKYAVFPYLSCSACKLSSLTVADMLTIVTSHEIREAVTDPGDFNQNAWYDRRGYEADDKCAWHNLYQMTTGGFWVQPEYSNGGAVTGSGITAIWPGPGCVVPNR
jgi:hypothetical protein